MAKIKELLNHISWMGLRPLVLMSEDLTKNRKKAMALTLMLTFLLIFVGCSDPAVENSNDNTNKESVVERTVNDSEESKLNKENEEDETKEEIVDKDPFEGYKLIEVEGGNQSGHREPNVVVDIGFGDREYYAYTNEHGQLVKVTAKKIIPQDDSTEPVLSTGRYYSDEAKVPGVESSTLDEGHVIADSLGGVSNAYNITPQNSTLNRHGDQAYMEKVIRDAGGCTDFVAIITYPNTETQIPSHYSYTYMIKGNTVNDEFDNVNPDEVNAKLETQAPQEKQTESTEKEIMIAELDKKAEYIVIKNSGSDSVDITGWRIISVKGNQSFAFPKFTLEPKSTVKVGDSERNLDTDFHWLDGNGTWNNSKSDPAELYNTKGELVDRYED